MVDEANAGSDPGNFGLMLPLSLYTENTGLAEQ